MSAYQEFQVGQFFTNSTGGPHRVIEKIDGDKIGYRLVASSTSPRFANFLRWAPLRRFRWWVSAEASGSSTPLRRKAGLNEVVMRDGYAELILTDKIGREAARTKVSMCDLQRLREYGWRWYANRRMPTSGLYAECRVGGKAQSLHRFLIDAPAGISVDHINGNPLDNRRENLRLVTLSQNSQNRPPDRDSSTGVKNVCWDKTRQKFRVYLMVKGKNRNLGYYSTLEEASEVARNARLSIHTHSPDHVA